MRNSKLLKSILIPTLGISTIGTIVAVSEGTATITTTSVDNPNVKANSEVTVNDSVVHVTSVSLNEDSVTLDEGDSKKILMTVLPEDATDKSVTWTSSNPAIVDVWNGIIVAIHEGTATVTATSVDNPNAKATCEVTVNDTDIHVTNVELNKSSTTLSIGETETLTVTVLPTNANWKSVAWTSSDTNVATVDCNGTITAKATGTVTITSTSYDNPNAKDTCEVTVIDQPKLDQCIIVTANDDSTLALINVEGNNPDLQYSTDGNNWSPYGTSININQGQNLYLKGYNPNGWSHYQQFGSYSTFSITGNVSISGNVMGLLDNGAKPGEQGDITDIPCQSCFFKLFLNSSGIASVSKNFLPATTLTNTCYEGMFCGCTSLATAPDLPATIVTRECYRDMFFYCYPLTTAPNLPATTLAEGCYWSMFAYCTSLTSVQETLPATTLTTRCYSNMFCCCSSLTTAPYLPATELVDCCYEFMFDGCTHLTSVRIGYTGTAADAQASMKWSITDWVNGVAQTGIFYYYKGTDPDPITNFGFPSGWTISPTN